MPLTEWGYDQRFARAAEGAPVGRVLAEHKGGYQLVCEDGERLAQLAGRAKVDVTGEELPAVGDWVALDGEQIVRVLPRRSTFKRRSPGRQVQAQVVAANVDTVFVVAGLDGDFNLRRLERYLVMVYASGAQPVLLLNKADLGTAEEALDDAKRLGELPVVTLSALEGSGLDALSPWLRLGQTVAVLGSSGVGKSTLINALLGSDRQQTQEVREDSRGRHTTTTRQLLKLPSGALIVDTPGLRELQLWNARDGLALAFPEVTRLAQQCHFRGCSHTHEPKCAVKAALEAETLDAERFDSWLTLSAELDHLDSERSPSARRGQKTRDREASRVMRQIHRRKR